MRRLTDGCTQIDKGLRSFVTSLSGQVLPCIEAFAPRSSSSCTHIGTRTAAHTLQPQRHRQIQSHRHRKPQRHRLRHEHEHASHLGRFHSPVASSTGCDEAHMSYLDVCGDRELEEDHKHTADHTTCACHQQVTAFVFIKVRP